MRIVFFRHSLLNRGGDKMVLAYAGRLAENGHEVSVYTNIVDSVFQIPHGVAIKKVFCPGKLGTILSALFQRMHADVVIGDIVATAFLLSFRNWGRVVHFAQDYNENFYHNFLQKLLVRCLYAVTLSLFKVSTIAVSAQLAEELDTKFDAHAKVIENGIDLRVFYPAPSDSLQEAKRGRKAILFFSRRDHRKGFDLALETIGRILARSEIPIVVWTVGEPLRDGEVACPRHDFGYVGEAGLRGILSSADLFLYPSRFEGFPVMVLEAFACQCPVVTTNAIPYAIDNYNALVTRIEDVDGIVAKVKRVLTDQGLVRRLADSASSFVLEYSLESAAGEFEQVLNKIAMRQ